MANCPDNYYECPCGGCSNSGCDYCFDMEGCADNTALNYNETCTDASPCLSCDMSTYPNQSQQQQYQCCIYPNVGCTDPGAENFEGEGDNWIACEGAFPNDCCEYACEDDGDCDIYYYCDTTQEPYECALGNADVGCTDPSSPDFDPDADVDIYGECGYPSDMDGSNNNYPRNTTGARYYYNVLAQEYYDENVHLQNRVMVELHAEMWNPPVSLESDWDDDYHGIIHSIDEDTELVIPFSNNLHREHGYWGFNTEWNKAPLVVWEFPESYYAPEHDRLYDGSIGEIHLMWNVDCTTDGDIPTNSLYPTNDFSVDCFRFSPNANWNGIQTITAKARVLKDQSHMLWRQYFSDSGGGLEFNNHNHYIAEGATIFSEIDEPIRITYWLKTPEEDSYPNSEWGHNYYKMQVRKTGGEHGYNPGFDWVDLGDINQNQQHNPEGMRPYTFTITRTFLENAGGIQFTGDWEFRIVNTTPSPPDEGGAEALLSSGLYIYNITNADYTTLNATANIETIPVPDQFDYTENPDHPIPDTIDVQAADPRGKITFDYFAGKECSISKYNCSDNIIYQFLTSEIKTNPNRPPEGEVFPTSTGYDEPENLRYEFYHNGSIQKDSYITVQTKDAEGNIYVALNGEIRNIQFQEGDNYALGEGIFNWQIDNETFSFDGGETGVLKEGLNEIQFWRTTDGGQLLRFAIWQEGDSCPDDNDECEHWGTIVDHDVVPEGDYHALQDCVQNNLCGYNAHDDGWTLTDLGLIFFDYYLTYNSAGMVNVLYPNELIDGVLFQSSVSDYQSLVDSWNADKGKEFLVQGFRNTDNDCCTPYGDYPDFDCIESLQTRFQITDVAPLTYNLLDNPTGKHRPDYNQIIDAGSSKYQDTYTACARSADSVYAQWPDHYSDDKLLPWEEFHSEAVRPLHLGKSYGRWSTGRNCFPGTDWDQHKYWRGTVNQGHHAHWIESQECLSGGACIKFPRYNTKYYPAPEYNYELDTSVTVNNIGYNDSGVMYVHNLNRWLGLHQALTSNINEDYPQINVGSQITISCMIKAKPNSDTTHATPDDMEIAVGLYHKEYSSEEDDLIDTFGNALERHHLPEDWDEWIKVESTFTVDEEWELSQRMVFYVYGHYGLSTAYGDIVVDNLQISVTPFSGYFLQEDLMELPTLEKYYYQHFALGAHILNSPLTFCEGDKILKESQFGYGSPSYDAIISPQPVYFEAPVQIKRNLRYKGTEYLPGISPIGSWQLGVNHQNIGILEGTILEASAGVIGQNVYEMGPDSNADSSWNITTVNNTDNRLGFYKWIQNEFESDLPLSYFMGTFNYGAWNPQNHHKMQHKVNHWEDVKYLPVPLEFIAETPTNNFHFNSFIFDAVGCVDETQYTWPLDSHQVLDNVGNETGKVLPAFTSQPWKDIESNVELHLEDDDSMAVNYFFNSMDSEHKTLDETPNSKWVEFGKHAQGDYGINGWETRLLDENNQSLLYDYNCKADGNQIHYDYQHMIGIGTCDYTITSQAVCMGHLSLGMFWQHGDALRYSWDDDDFIDTHGGCCKTWTGPRINDRYIGGPDWIIGNTDNDNMYQNLRHVEGYQKDGDIFDLSTNINVKQTGFYHAPLAIQLKYYTIEKPFSKIDSIYPQPLDFPNQFPASSPFDVTMSLSGYSNEFGSLYNKFDNSYPRVENEFQSLALEELGIGSQVLYSQDSTEQQLAYGVRYQVSMSAHPKQKHRFSETFSETAYDGINDTLPFYSDGLPFYVDDLYIDETQVSYVLQKPAYTDEGNGQCISYEEAYCEEGTNWMEIATDEFCCWSDVSKVTFGQTFTQDINILDANPPKIHSIVYSENAKRQVGIQQGQLIEYDLVGTNLISYDYLQSSAQHGSRAKGGIDFANYALGDNAAVSTYIAVGTPGSDEIQLISDLFTIESDAVWFNVVEAINNGFEGVQTHIATLADNIQPAPPDNIFKTVIIESLYPGDNYNGVITWGVQDEQLSSQPNFTQLQGGTTYPVVPIYEDFEYFDLEILASDIDSETKLTYQIDTENEYILSASIHDYEYYDTNLGDTEFDGGDGIANLEGDEATASARIRLFTYPSTYNEILNAGEDTETEQTLPLIANYNGPLEFVIRAMDKATMFDSYKIQLNVKPVNDPPLMEIVGDREVYMNNLHYPTQLSVPIETIDVEEGRNTLDFQSVKEINQEYCDTLATVVGEILINEGIDANGDVTSCDGRFECRHYCGPWPEELLSLAGETQDHICDYADFNNDNIISDEDIQDCYSAVETANVAFQTLEISETPHWINTLNTYQGQTWEEHLQFEGQDNPDEYHAHWNDLNPKKFLRVTTEYDTFGTAKFRIKATDNGLNENGEVDEIRTGYTTGSINVKPLNTDGPTGEILAIEYASLGVMADTYLYNTLGPEVRTEIPDKDSLINNINVTTYGYHTYTNGTPDGMVASCGNLSYQSNGIIDTGFVNFKGECCSMLPTTGIDDNSDTFLSSFWDSDINYYYEEDFNDAVSDYVNYITYFMEAPYNDNFGSQVCGFNLESSANYYSSNIGPFTYKGTTSNNLNVGGYVTPNQELNTSDHIVSYKLEIEDLVDSYDLATLVQSGSGVEYSEQFEGFEINEQGNMHEPWADKWNALAQEGWPTSGSNNPNYGRVVFQTPTIPAPSRGTRIIEEGFVYRFDYPSVFLITVKAVDSYGFTGKTETLIDARNLVYLKQTLLEQYSPWQGMNITGSRAVENTFQDMEGRDYDERKSLGLFYYDEINPVDDWNMKYGNSYRGMDGNWINSFPVDYYYGDVFNKIQFSENFDNKYIRADIGTFFNEDNGAIYFGIMKKAFGDFQWPSIASELPEDTLEEMHLIAEQIQAELGMSGIALFNAWSTGKIDSDSLPIAVQGIVQSIEQLMTEPLVVESTVIKALEEESSIESYDVDEQGNEVEFKKMCTSVNQDSSKTLDCGEGKSIKRVMFDSYGLPFGECGVYGVNPECHCTPGGTHDWLNKRTVTVTANNSLCGNSCEGIDKYRYVEVMCGYDRYNKWYKGGRIYENADYASISDGVEVYDNKAPGPDKTLLEGDKENKAYLVYQKDALSDYWGRHLCTIDYNDDMFANNPYYKLPSEWSQITADGSDDLQDSTKTYTEYFISDEAECQQMCVWRDYTPENNTCTQTAVPSDETSKCNHRECGSSNWNSYYSNYYNSGQSGQSLCESSSCGADVFVSCLENGLAYNYGQGGYMNYVCIKAVCADYCYQYECEGSNFHFNNVNDDTAKNTCISNCYTDKAYGNGEPGSDCVEISENNDNAFADSGILTPYRYYLGQNNLVESVDRERTDRIFSVYMRPYFDEDKSGVGGDNSIPGTKAFEPTVSTIMFRAVADTLPENDEDIIGFSEYGTDSVPVVSTSGLFYYGYSIKMDINWNEIVDGTSVWYSPDMHPEYPDVPLWGIETVQIDPDDGLTDEPKRGIWYKFWVRTLHDKNISEYKTEIYPGGFNGTDDASVFLFGAQVQEIKPYDEVQLPYQPTRFPGEVGLYDFIPDVDVRTINSADGFKSRLYEYYDDELQPGKYSETSAPLTAQLYFYLRNPFDKALFQPKDVVSYPHSSLYVGFVDWGDGSVQEYKQEPWEVREASVLTHTFEESGVYEIKGEIFNVARDTNGIVLGIGTFYTFLLRINVNINKEIEGEFQLLGGEKYTFIPYQTTFPVVSGVSDKSIYKKTIKRNLGYMTDNPENKIDVPFKYHGDEMKTEQALATLDERFIGPTVSAYTGSYPSQSGLDNTDTVEIYGGSDACELVITEENEELWRCTSTLVTYESNYVCSENCRDYEEAQYAPKGFYDGNVDVITGELVAEGSNYIDVDGVTQLNNIIPKLINKGADLYPGELGDFLGDTDIAQLRYFETPVSMWELLGFPCENASEDSIINYISPILNPENISSWTHYDIEVSPSNYVPASLNTLFDGSYSLVLNSSDESSIQTTYEVPLGPGYEGIVGKTFVFSFYVRKHQNNDTDLEVNAVIYRGTQSPDVVQINEEFEIEGSKETFMLDAGWQRVELTYTFEEEGNDNKINVGIWPAGEGDIIYVVAPQLQRNVLTDYRFPNNPLLEGSCTEASSGNPSSEKYYKNVVPITHNLLTDREGITTYNDELVVDEESSQQWLGTNYYGNSYYYPVLPKLNRLGRSQEILQTTEDGSQNVPFGSIGRGWDELDSISPITNLKIYNTHLVDDCLLDIDFGEESDQSLEDLSGNTNLAIFIGDYQVSFNSATMSPKKKHSFRTMVVGQKPKQKAY